MHVKVPIFDFGWIREKAELARAKTMGEERLMLDLRHDIDQQLSEQNMFLQHLEEKFDLIKSQIDQVQEELRLNHAKSRRQLVPQVAVLRMETTLLELRLALSEVRHDRKLTHV
jgi:outer membrane protein TolC